MVIDIDKFLDDFNQNKLETKESTRNVDLEFQKDVEDRIQDVKKLAQSREVSFLKKIYDEVKDFDQDLPSKFFGIENVGGSALENVGERYSDEFFNVSKNNVEILTKRINEGLALLDQELPSKDFTKILARYRSLLVDYAHFPKTFMVDRVEIGKKLRLKEVELNELLGVYKTEVVNDTKQRLFEALTNLKNAMLNMSIDDTEKYIVEIEAINNSIPKVLLSNFTQERAIVSKVLYKAESFLVEKYKEDFDFKVKDIESLVERFHKEYIDKDLDKVLLTYNEIISEFRSLPEVFIEKKIHIYKKVNGLFDLVNKLIMNRNVSLFMETYEYGKKIEALKEYLRHVSLMKTVSTQNLVDIKKRIEDLPEKYYIERRELLMDLKKIVMEKGKNVQIEHKVKKEEKPAEVKKNVQKSPIVSSINIMNPVEKLNSDFETFKRVNDRQEVMSLYRVIVNDLNNRSFEMSFKKSFLKKLNEELIKKKFS